MQSTLDLPIVQALSKHRTHPSLRASANAWLAAYDLAHQLGFNEGAALGQADTAWDRAAEPWRLSVGDEPAHTLTEYGRRAIQVRH